MVSSETIPQRLWNLTLPAYQLSVLDNFYQPEYRGISNETFFWIGLNKNGEKSYSWDSDGKIPATFENFYPGWRFHHLKLIYHSNF